MTKCSRHHRHLTTLYLSRATSFETKCTIYTLAEFALCKVVEGHVVRVHVSLRSSNDNVSNKQCQKKHARAVSEQARAIKKIHTWHCC